MQIIRLFCIDRKEKQKLKFIIPYICFGVIIVCSFISLASDPKTSFNPSSEDEIIEDLPAVSSRPKKQRNRSYADIKFLTEERDFCRSKPEMEIIAYVHSSISRIENRRITRETWANVTSYGAGINMGVLFVVGRPHNDTERRVLLQETKKFRDILQIDLEDDYHLLSYKGLAALSWINNHCDGVPWTVHADDDVLIDIFLLALNLRSYDVHKTDHFYCNTMYSKALKKGKWAVDAKEYPRAVYPTFCSGEMWALPTHVIPKLLKASLKIPFLWVDDVYVTGVLAEKANVSRHGDPDGYGSSQMKARDIGVYHAWHGLRDRPFWWNKIVRRYEKHFPGMKT